MRCVALPLMALLMLFALLLYSARSNSAPVKLILFYCSARKSKFLPKPLPHLGLRMVFMAHRSGEDERRGGSQLIWVFGIAWHRMVLHGIVRRGAMPGRACWGWQPTDLGGDLPASQADRPHPSNTQRHQHSIEYVTLMDTFNMVPSIYKSNTCNFKCKREY